MKSYQTTKAQESEKNIYKKAIYKAYLWLDRHPANFEDDGPLVVFEEILTFYILMRNTEDASEKKDYFYEIQKRINLIALNKDFKVQPQEYTWLLTFTAIAEKLGIHTVDFRKIIEDQLMSIPFPYSQYITGTIWNTVYLERLGYNPSIDLESLMAKSVLKQELDRRTLLQFVSSSINQKYVYPMTVIAYCLTHEIFSLTDFGELPPPPIITNNRAFFSIFFDKTIQWAMATKQQDLLAELIMCVKMIDIKDVPSLRQGIEFILSSQQDNGTFGITNPSFPNVYRHGVLVSMMALSMV
jgi:hypothetical protein